MAKFQMGDFPELREQLRKMEGTQLRGIIKRIVTAGAEAEKKVMTGQITGATHVQSGSMLQNVGEGTYHETMGGGEIHVYPQGVDDKGVSNAMKAFVINYGRGRKSARMGDKFITGSKPSRQAEAAINDAMQAEAEKVFQELGLTE